MGEEGLVCAAGTGRTGDGCFLEESGDGGEGC